MNEDLLKTVLNNVVDAWESIEGGRNHSLGTIENWLIDDMAPAIQEAREAIGRKRPDE